MQNTKKTKLVETNVKVTTQAPTVLLTQTQSTQKQALLVAKQNVANAVPLGTGVTHHTAGNVIKGLLPQPQIAKPTLAMCRYINAVPTFKYAQGQCQHRKHLYVAGCTLLHAKLTLGLTPNDLTYWHSIGVVTLETPTPSQYNAIIQAWQAGQLVPNTNCPITGKLITQGTYTNQALITWQD
jgi:hypothetical protein